VSSRHGRVSVRWRQVFIGANALLLVALTAWILRPSGGAPAAVGVPTPVPATTSASGAPAATNVPSKDQLLAAFQADHVHFGLSSPKAPFDNAELTRIGDAAGANPTMIQFFVKWTQDLRASAIEAAYRRGALPIISWEPWAGNGAGVNQPDYALAKITAGRYDAYLTKFATAIRDRRYPVAIRFAHEMNGVWYPWSESKSGNHKGDYVAAWRHVHDVFTHVGADNAIWIWSPNIIRPVPKTDIAKLYPGDAYVDWVGMVGYAVHESTAAPVYTPTLRKIRTFSQKPLVITETGVQPGPGKAAWIRDFFNWLGQQHDIVGFVWFEFSKEQGGSADWRFEETPATQQAFQQGIAGAALGGPPITTTRPG